MPAKKVNISDDENLKFYTSSANGWDNIRPNQSVRTGFTSEDYEYFRPEEAMPKSPKKVIASCNAAYKKTGIVRNIIDLMGDFGCQGINIVHPNPKSQKILRKWFKSVHGKERSERFLNTFYRLGNVVIYRQMAVFRTKLMTDYISATGTDIEVDPKPKFVKRELPARYMFYNPCQIEIDDQELSSFVGSPQYYLNVSSSVVSKIKSAKTDKQKQLVDKIPNRIKDQINAKEKKIWLDPDRLRIFHYKKDDWELWATPMIYSILPDLRMLEKLHLCDLSALDGAISNIRLWTLGDLEKGIKPTPAALQHLANILKTNPGGGVIDLVWGPDLKVQSLSSDVHQYLGIEKYVPTLNKIFSGLGIPQTLSGGEAKGGFTNNAISVKTLVERLNYGRDALVEFWAGELEIVQKQLGIRPIAELQFERMTLSDEAAEKALWLQLWDRDLVSTETIQEKFGESADIEKLRWQKQHKDIESGKLPNKASQWHKPEHKKELEKIALQNALATPSQVGLDYPPPKPEEKKMLKDNTPKPGVGLKKSSTGRPGQGRPRGKKDGAKRKAKRVVPVGASLMLWATKAYQKVSELTMPAILKHFNKTNARQLTEEEFEISEKVKFNTFCELEPFTEITKDVVGKTLAALPCSNKVYNTYSSLVSDLKDTPTTEDKRYLMVYAYCLDKESNNGDNPS